MLVLFLKYILLLFTFKSLQSRLFIAYQLLAM